MILTSEELQALVQAAQLKQRSARISLNLGLSFSDVALSGTVALFPDGLRLDLTSLGTVDVRSCYTLQDGALVKLQFFSSETNRHYKLVPTKDWPTVTVSGVPMHQKTRVTPREDAMQKTGAVEVRGMVLDTCSGLGYTAILASEKADHVMTVEKDGNILALGRVNPHSAGLFTNEKIELVHGDVSIVLKDFKEEFFDVIIHDPPTFKLAGELYGTMFYRELFRVLRSRCWMFHYTGRPGIKRGRSFIGEVIKRLGSVGFCNMKTVMGDQAVICQKPSFRSRKHF